MGDFDHTRIGVAVLPMLPSGKIFMLRRRGAHGSGEWSVPGGHVEKWEPLHHAAVRELREETGLSLNPGRLVAGPWSNDEFRSIDRHYITIFFGVQLRKGERLYNRETEKASEVELFDPRQPPSPLFGPTADLFARLLVPMTPEFERLVWGVRCPDDIAAIPVRSPEGR